MTEKELKQYLEAFYAGESTIEMERALTDYFLTATEVPAELQADAAMFRAMGRIESDVPADLEHRIIDATVNRAPKRIFRRTLPFGMAAAAAAALLLVTLHNAEPAASPYREVTDPDEAGAIAMQVGEKLLKTVDKLTILNNLPI